MGILDTLEDEIELGEGGIQDPPMGDPEPPVPMDRKKQWVYDKVKSLLGDPIVPLLQSDLRGLEAAIKLAYSSYWVTYPYMFRTDIKGLDSLASPIVVKYTDIIAKAFEGLDYINPETDAYMLGVVELFENVGASPMGWINFDSYLLGVNYRMNPYPSASQYPVDYYNTILANKSSVRLFAGTANVEPDEIRQEFHIYIPTMTTSYVISYAIGLIYAGNLNFIEENKLIIFSMKVAVNFLEQILASRSAVQVTSDFNISLDFVKSKLDELKPQLEDKMVKTARLPILFG